MMNKSLITEERIIGHLLYCKCGCAMLNHKDTTSCMNPDCKYFEIEYKLPTIRLERV